MTAPTITLTVEQVHAVTIDVPVTDDLISTARQGMPAPLFHDVDVVAAHLRANELSRDIISAAEEAISAGDGALTATRVVRAALPDDNTEAPTPGQGVFVAEAPGMTHVFPSLADALDEAARHTPEPELPVTVWAFTLPETVTTWEDAFNAAEHADAPTLDRVMLHRTYVP